MTITVQDKTFIINLVNNYVHEQHNKLVEMSHELSQLGDDMIETANEVNKLKPFTAEKKQAKKELAEIKAQFDKIKNDITVYRWDILKNLCISNKIEFNENWWMNETGIEDINDFIIACVNKDADMFKGQDLKKK